MLAVISDIHGNLGGLEAILADAGNVGADGLVCLGDVASFGPQPRETLRRVQALGCPVIMGNADDEILYPDKLKGLEETRIDSNILFDIVSWCAEQLTDADRDFIRTFQPTVKIELEKLPILCFHGSPRSYNDVIVATTPDETLAQFFQKRAPLMLGGHTHQPILRRFQDITFVNPGSVGSPYELLSNGEARNPAWAEYALIEVVGGQPSITFRRVPYNVTPVLETAKRSGMPHAAWWCADWSD